MLFFRIRTANAFMLLFSKRNLAFYTACIIKKYDPLECQLIVMRVANERHQAKRVDERP